MPELLGAQRPRLELVPPAPSSAADEAIELATSAGLDLDEAQRHVLRGALGVRDDGKWAAFEVAVIEPRQNGKGGIIEARQLAGAFLFAERMITYSAHEFKTAQEMFRRVEMLIEDTPDLDREVIRKVRSTNEMGIELRSRARLRWLARSSGSGRGFTGDCTILDEAMILRRSSVAALLPTMSARPNPQLWYLGSSGDEESVVLGEVRSRALAALGD